jgi:carbamoyl-phosphate synthase large subunit
VQNKFYKKNINQKIRDYCYTICKKFDSSGPLNIQLRLDERDNPVCFEINLRFSGTTPIRAEFGFNDVHASINEYVLNYPVKDVLKFSFGYSLRFMNEMYVRYNSDNLDKIESIKVESFGIKK